jgi:hypothetical protein
MVETVVGCKWSLTVVDLVQRGIRRPGAMERTVEGLSAKVLNDCLRLLVSYGVFEKRSFAEIPPRVEYHSPIHSFGGYSALTGFLSNCFGATNSYHDGKQRLSASNHFGFPCSRTRRVSNAHNRFRSPATSLRVSRVRAAAREATAHSQSFRLAIALPYELWHSPYTFPIGRDRKSGGKNNE